MRGFVVSLSLLITIACAAVLSADTSGDVARYSFTVANAPKDAMVPDGRFRLRVVRWSTDAERQQLMDALDQPSTLLQALPYSSAAGYLQWPGGLDYTVRYARQTARPDGGADIVLLVERPVWVWWDAKTPWAADQRFTVVQLRVSKDGTGEGRIATGTGFTRDARNGVAISDSTQPALLTDIRREAVAS